jgi:hypothetical protein
MPAASEMDSELSIIPMSARGAELIGRELS